MYQLQWMHKLQRQNRDIIQRVNEYIGDNLFADGAQS